MNIAIISIESNKDKEILRQHLSKLADQAIPWELTSVSSALLYYLSTPQIPLVYLTYYGLGWNHKAI